MAAKASAVYYFQKSYSINKTRQLKPGKGTGIWWVMAPHWGKTQEENFLGHFKTKKTNGEIIL